MSAAVLNSEPEGAASPAAPAPSTNPVETDDSDPQAVNGLPVRSGRSGQHAAQPPAATGEDGPATVLPGTSQNAPTQETNA
jgi:hypothetical protein